MKQIIILFILVVFNQLSWSQTISSDPEFPTATEPITVYLDATGTGLQGYTGDVYAHTGVNLTNGADWQYVIGDWGNNTNQPKLTRISTDNYSLEISTSVNDFYGVGGSHTVDQLTFVFRSADGSQQTNDLTLNIYTESNTVSIILPDTNDIFAIGDSALVQAVALFADSIKLYLDDTLYFGVESTILNKKVKALVAGKKHFKVIAKDDTDADTVESFFFVRKDNIVADLPNGVEYGINYIDDNTVTLVLNAPFKEYVFVIGDFNNWNLSLDYQMNITPDETTYWLTINGLTAQEEYAFQYYVDGEILIADPYTDKVLDPWNDSYIDNTTYPNLKPYPSEAEGIVSVFQTAQTSYNWQIDDFQRPEKHNLVIYELHIRDFIEAHNYQTMIDTINYLKNLGVNAIELMPVNEFEGNSSWGYNPSFYFAPDKYYGTKNKLKEFIDVCHQNEMAVIMDIVYNHSYGQSPLVLLYLDEEVWQVTSENPWYNVESPNPVYSWGYDFDHESQATVDFFDRNITYWLTEYKFDGFRFDFTKGFTNTPGDGWAYDQARIDILKHYYDVTQIAEVGSYLILEHLAANNEEKALADYGLMLWGNTNYNYSQAAMGWSSESDFSWISYKNRNWANPNLVGYMESHDEERMMFRNLEYGNSSDNYNVKDLHTALERVELAATFFITIPGPKMLWQFEELGYDVSIDDPCRVCEKPIKWEYFDDYYRNRLYQVFSSLIELKNTYSVFKTSNFTMNTSSMQKEVILEGDTMDVVIIGNFDVETGSITPNFTQTGTWYEFFTHTEITVGGNITLAPGEYKLFTSKQLNAPNLPDLAVAPEILSVNITGDTTISSVLSGSYSFYDFNDDEEGTSTYQWYTSEYADGRSPKKIQDATDTVYTVTEDDFLKFIGFEVTPVAISDDLTIGNSKKSSFIGPMSYKTGNNLTIFPNPFSDIVNFINISDFNDIYISDVAGNLIIHEEINAKNFISFNLETLEEGVYLVKIVGETEEKTFKILKF